MRDQKLEGRQGNKPPAGDAPGSAVPVHEPGTSIHTRQHDYAYYKEIFSRHTMPFAYLDLELFDQNIRQVVARAGGKRVRLASKSLRSVSVIRRIFASDPCFQGIMCYTAPEAVYLASQGFDDLLVGYPAWNEQDIAAVARAVAAGTHITLMVDSLEHVGQVETVALRQGVRLPLCLEIDMSMDLPGLHFGVWRSPLRTPEQARPVIERIMASSHIWLDGLMGYEAQIAGAGDNFPGHAARNAVVQRLKQRSLHEIAARRAALVELVRTYGLSLRFVNGGGTGSIATTVSEPLV